MTDPTTESIEAWITNALDEHKDDAFIQITPGQLRRYGESKVAGEREACMEDCEEYRRNNSFLYENLPSGNMVNTAIQGIIDNIRKRGE